MAVRVEPPHGRHGPRDSTRYPGLTAEERGLERPPPRTALEEMEPPPPLWVIPSEIPKASRPTGFVGPLPDSAAFDALPPEGLFDVPGLLERLWLARALEAHRERSLGPASGGPGRDGARDAAVPTASPAQSGGVPLGPSTRAPADPKTAADAPRSVPSPTASSVPTPVAPPVAEAPSRPRSWICPYCYLTNDANAATCRGCRSSTLHL